MREKCNLSQMSSLLASFCSYVSKERIIIIIYMCHIYIAHPIHVDHMLWGAVHKNELLNDINIDYKSLR